MALRTEKERIIKDKALKFLKENPDKDFDYVCEFFIKKNKNIKIEDVCYCVEIAYSELNY